MVAAAPARRGARAALAADAERLGADALNEDRLDQALLLARHGVALDDSAVTRSNLLAVLLRNPAVLGEVDTGWNMFAAALSPDGRQMALGDERGNLSVYDAKTRLPAGRPYWIQGGLIQSVSFSPDGRTLAVGSLNPLHPARPLVDVIDRRSGRRRLRIELPAVPKPDPYVYARRPVRWRLAGRAGRGPRRAAVAALTASTPPSGAVAGRLTLAGDPSARERRRRPPLRHQRARSPHVGARSAAAPRVLRTFAVGGATGTVSPDGRRYALGAPDGRVRLLDLASGTVEPLAAGHGAGISALRFTPDSRTLVTGDEAGRLIAWNVAQRTIAQRFPGHAGEAELLDISPDGRTLLSSGADRRTLLWDLAGDQRLDRRFSVGPDFTPIDDTPRGIAVSPSGHTLALTQVDGTVDLLDTRTLRRRGPRARAGREGAVDRVQPRRPTARRDRSGRARDALGHAHARTRRRAEGDARRLPGARLLARRDIARRRPGRDRRTAAAGARLGRAHAPPHRLPRPDLGRPDRLQPGRPAARRGRRRARYRDPRRGHGPARHPHRHR